MLKTMRKPYKNLFILKNTLPLPRQVKINTYSHEFWCFL